MASSRIQVISGGFVIFALETNPQNDSVRRSSKIKNVYSRGECVNLARTHLTGFRDQECALSARETNTNQYHRTSSCTCTAILLYSRGSRSALQVSVQRGSVPRRVRPTVCSRNSIYFAFFVLCSCECNLGGICKLRSGSIYLS